MRRKWKPRKLTTHEKDDWNECVRGRLKEMALPPLAEKPHRLNKVLGAQLLQDDPLVEILHQVKKNSLRLNALCEHLKIMTDHVVRLLREKEGK